jgi:hypothetical protein
MQCHVILSTSEESLNASLHHGCRPRFLTPLRSVQNDGVQIACPKNRHGAGRRWADPGCGMLWTWLPAGRCARVEVLVDESHYISVRGKGQGGVQFDAPKGGQKLIGAPQANRIAAKWLEMVPAWKRRRWAKVTRIFPVPPVHALATCDAFDYAANQAAKVPCLRGTAGRAILYASLPARDSRLGPAR